MLKFYNVGSGTHCWSIDFSPSWLQGGGHDPCWTENIYKLTLQENCTFILWKTFTVQTTLLIQLLGLWKLQSHDRCCYHWAYADLLIHRTSPSPPYACVADRAVSLNAPKLIYLLVHWLYSPPPPVKEGRGSNITLYWKVIILLILTLCSLVRKNYGQKYKVSLECPQLLIHCSPLSISVQTWSKIIWTCTPFF